MKTIIKLPLIVLSCFIISMSLVIVIFSENDHDILSERNDVLQYSYKKQGEIDHDNTTNINNLVEYWNMKNNMDNVLKDYKDKNSSIYKTTISEYAKHYKLNSVNHCSCSYVIRPNYGDIEWHKNTYQHFHLKFGNFNDTEIFALKFYYDDRFLAETASRYVRIIVTMKGNGILKNFEETPDALRWVWAMNGKPWNVLLWYNNFEHPMNAKCKIQTAGGLVRNVTNTYFHQCFLSCVVPEIGILPTHASIVRRTCDTHPNTYFEIVYPEEPDDPSIRDIGVCMASLYGKMSRKDIPMFVNWMEGLKMLGVKDVSMNNASMIFEDRDIWSVFQYYIVKGSLTFTHYPTIHSKWHSEKEADAATEAINKITTGDCIYNNLKKYWYVLIIDKDELPVPTHFDTYQEFLSDYINKHTNLTHAHCFAIRSSFFYLHHIPGNLEYGEHLPILRYTNKFRTEPMEVDGVGMSKSFHNMRNMVAAGHHLTRLSSTGKAHDLIHEFMSDKDILIHHYRSTCRYGNYCKSNWNDIIKDDILPRKYGEILKENIEKVLRDVGYQF